MLADELSADQVNECVHQAMADELRKIASTPSGRALLASIELQYALSYETMGLARDKGLKRRHVRRLWENYAHKSTHVTHTLHELWMAEGTITEYMILAGLLGFELEIEIKIDPSSQAGYRVTVMSAPVLSASV